MLPGWRKTAEYSWCDAFRLQAWNITAISLLNDQRQAAGLRHLERIIPVRLPRFFGAAPYGIRVSFFYKCCAALPLKNLFLLFDY